MKKFFILTGLLLPLFIQFSVAQTNTGLTVEEFEKGAAKDSVQLLDVRTAAEFNTGHLKNAMLADWKDETEFYRRIGFIDKQVPVYIHCLGGGRSAAAATKMRSMGYRHVFELIGGINSWKAENKAVKGRSNEKQFGVDELNKAISGSRFVLVDFGAGWCPPCRKMEPVIKSLQSNNPGKFTLVKVDGGRDEEIVKNYGVTALPVFILCKNGRQVWRKEGIVTEKEIAGLLK